MATINCPHCGQIMYDLLETCPHCGGPVMSEALKKAKEKQALEYEAAMEIVAREEEAEKEKNLAAGHDAECASLKKWFLGATVAGILWALMIFVPLVSEFSDNTADMILLICILPFLIWVPAGFVYACRAFHPILRFGGVICIPFLGWLLIIYVLFLTELCGIFYYYPRAIGRFILRKPLITYEEYLKNLEKGYIVLKKQV